MQVNVGMVWLRSGIFGGGEGFDGCFGPVVEEIEEMEESERWWRWLESWRVRDGKSGTRNSCNVYIGSCVVEQANDLTQCRGPSLRQING